MEMVLPTAHAKCYRGEIKADLVVRVHAKATATVLDYHTLRRGGLGWSWNPYSLLPRGAGDRRSSIMKLETVLVTRQVQIPYGRLYTSRSSI